MMKHKPFLQNTANLQGIYVKTVKKGSPADKAGLSPLDHIIKVICVCSRCVASSKQDHRSVFFLFQINDVNVETLICADIMFQELVFNPNTLSLSLQAERLFEFGDSVNKLTVRVFFCKLPTVLYTFSIFMIFTLSGDSSRSQKI